MKRAALFILIVSIPIFGIGMMGTNILEYRNATEGYSYFENRGEVIINHNNIEAAARLLMQQPSRYNFAEASDTTFQGIDHRYIRYSTSYMSVTAGTFYETFGRGLVLDLFEDRRMVIDHNLDGAKLSFDVPYVSGKVIHGIANWDYGNKVQGFEIVAKPPLSQIGASYLDYDGDITNRVNTYSIFGGINLPFGNLYAEFAEKHIVGEGDDGNALYASADFALGSYSFLVEYKNYQDYWMRGSIKYYNNPPSCVREPSYTLQSRYVHQQDLEYEQGFQFTHYGSYPFDIDLELSGAYITDSSDAYLEVFADFYREWDKIGQHLVIQYQDEGIGHTGTYITAIAHGYYLFDYTHNIQWDIELQNEVHDETDESYNHLMFGLEGVVMENLSIGTEVVMIDEEDSEPAPWAYISCDMIEGHSIILGYGKRAGGFTCAGGICRYELPFEGFELSVTSSF